MTSLSTGISWTDTTWNLSVGCNKVSPGCDNCYAETLVNRLPVFRHDFNDVQLHLGRLKDVRKFTPLRQADGSLLPRKVFVNSMSDFWHDKIPDEAIEQILTVMEAHPTIAFQVLTKRIIRARKLLVRRYANSGIPAHIWIGVSAEDNRVAMRLDILRSIKERVGSGTFFASVEPIVGPTDELDFTDVDWVILGGESGPGARTMDREWLKRSIINARHVGSAIWYKQNGKIASHPDLYRAPGDLTLSGKFQWLIDNGFEVLPAEKGGATINRVTFRELPRAYHFQTAELNQPE